MSFEQLAIKITEEASSLSAITLEQYCRFLELIKQPKEEHLKWSAELGKRLANAEQRLKEMFLAQSS